MEEQEQGDNSGDKDRLDGVYSEGMMLHYLDLKTVDLQNFTVLLEQTEVSPTFPS